MEVHLHPDTESRIQALASETGRPADDLVEDALAGYLRELGETRTLLDSRYDDLKSGRVKPVDGEIAFTQLRNKGRERRSRS
jgi:predicted DNA-binding protein